MNIRSKTNSRRGDFDWVLFIVYLSLVFIGLLMIYATTYHDTANLKIWDFQTVFGRQLLWAGVSLVLLFVVYFVDWRFWDSVSLPLYVIGIIALCGLLVFGTEINGSKSWLTFGSFSLQPSEFVKFSTAVFMSSVLSPIKIKLSGLRTQFYSFLLIFIPLILSVLQPDPGSALTFLSLFILLYRKGLPTVYFIAFLSMFLILVFSLKFDNQLVISIFLLCCLIFFINFTKARINSILLCVTLVLVNVLTYQFEMVYYSIGLNGLFLLFYLFRENRLHNFKMKISVLAGIAWLALLSFSASYGFNSVLKPHQQDRINVWLQPEKCDPRGSLYNLVQSKLAIGSGGLSGKGYLNGTLTKLNYVPEQTTDFIFSSIGEEQGFLGGASVILLFLILLMRILQTAERSKNAFTKNYGYAIAGFIFIHFFINIGMTMGIAPIIGIPLPFISKGGSALMAYSIMIGVMLRLGRER